MTDLLTLLDDFDIQPHAHILPSLERAHVSCADLLTLDASDVAKRAQIPSGEVLKLTDALIDGLRRNEDVQSDASLPQYIGLLDDQLDAAIGGGIRTTHLTEFVGESAVGKTQCLLTLLLAVQLPPPAGLGKSALYVSTEAPLQTKRLSQILNAHPKLCSLPDGDRPTLDRIHSTHMYDLEAQEHILRYQVPVAITRHNVGLVVIDSVAANYRSEFAQGSTKAGAESLAKRNVQLAQMGAFLRGLASTHNIAVVVANQVADRFTSLEPFSQMTAISQKTSNSRPTSPPELLSTTVGLLSQPVSSGTINPSALLLSEDPLALDHQQCFFTGWGDDASIAELKTPSLGLTWTNQLSTRIALLKSRLNGPQKAPQDGEEGISPWQRTLKIAFSASAAESSIDFQIIQGGVRAVIEKLEDKS